MKERRDNKKLKLHKLQVSKLNSSNMIAIKGGESTSDTMFPTTIPPTVTSGIA
ncbi:class I lanthipeptide [Aquimarina megaterium]|uniref:class I lanthipeptide n=1 Tax=Aquimarina megaterium TaxID=1443666 RepID=UPI0015866A8E|nr:class I lanthipeptide [Aquimarina megaterium]